MKKLNFTIGDDIGNILSDISYDYLMKFDIEKAISIWTDSLIGLPNDIAKKLTFGRLKLVRVDQEVELNNSDNNKIIENMIDKINDIFNVGNGTISDVAINIINYLANFPAESIRTELPIEGDSLINSATYYTDTYKVITYILSTGKMPYIDPDSLNEYESKILGSTVYLYNKCTTLFELDNKIHKVIDIMSEVTDVTELKRFVRIETDKLYKALNQLKLLIENKCIGEQYREKRDKKLNDYFNFEGSIDQFFNKIKSDEKFSSMDITLKYDAGFLAPDGSFYGMRGITVNLMHLKLADLISEYVETIPPEEERYKDSYLLNRLGYCKITHNWVQFVGGSELTKYLVGHFIDLTEAQKDAICRMADSCYNGIFLTHDYKEEIHTSRFKQMDKFQIRKLFE